MLTLIQMLFILLLNNIIVLMLVYRFMYCNNRRWVKSIAKLSMLNDEQLKIINGILFQSEESNIKPTHPPLTK